MRAPENSAGLWTDVDIWPGVMRWAGLPRNDMLWRKAQRAARRMSVRVSGGVFSMPGEFRAGGQEEIEPGDQRVGMIAQDAEEVDDLAIDIVEDFGPRAHSSAREHATHAAKGLGMAAVRGRLDARGDGPGEAFLAAEPRRERLGGSDGREARIIG